MGAEGVIGCVQEAEWGGGRWAPVRAVSIDPKS